MRLLSIGVLCISMFMLAVASAARPSNADLKKQVADTERAFAATMKARDHAAFTSFLSDEAVFFAGPGSVLRGRDAVASAWRKYYDGPQAPFSWEPEEVEVVDSGTLAYSGGPVYDARSWNGHWDELDESHHLYMGWDSKYMLTAVQGVLDEAGFASEVFVKYSYFGAIM